MIRRLSVALFAFVVGLALSAPAFAQGTPGAKEPHPTKPMMPAEKPGESTTPAPPGQTPAEKPAEKPTTEKPAGEKEAKGKVVSVSTSKKNLVLDVEGKKMTFKVGAMAAKDLSKIKRGDQVTVRYTEKGKQRTAQEVSKEATKG